MLCAVPLLPTDVRGWETMWHAWGAMVQWLQWTTVRNMYCLAAQFSSCRIWGAEQFGYAVLRGWRQLCNVAMHSIVQCGLSISIVIVTMLCHICCLSVLSLPIVMSVITCGETFVISLNIYHSSATACSVTASITLLTEVCEEIISDLCT